MRVRNEAENSTKQVQTTDGRMIDPSTQQYEDSEDFYFAMIGSLNSRIEDAQTNPTDSPSGDVKHFEHLKLQRDDLIAQYRTMYKRYVQYMSNSVDVVEVRPDARADMDVDVVMRDSPEEATE